MSTSSDQPSGTAGSHFQPSLPVVLVILLLFVATAFVVERSSSPTHSTTSPVTSTTTTPSGPGVTTTTTPKEIRVPRSQVSVQVANGTTKKGFAKTITQQLQTLGWNTLSAINGPNETATIVYYKTGFKWAAVDVAAQLRVPARSVHALGALQPVPGSSGDDLVVVLGPNAH